MLNEEYHLGLDATGKPSAAALDARKKEQEERFLQHHEQVGRWAAACDRERDARRVLELFTASDADKPEFSQALARMAAAQTELDAMWAGY